MSEPGEIRIDLRNPTFTPAVVEAFAAGAAMAELCPLTEDAILGQAMAETGLDDFGDDGFREPLGVLLTALNEEAGLSPMGQVSTFTQLLQMAKNRLLVEDTIKAHPEILAIDIERPIIIAGLPRTGTTHLQNVIAADPNLRFLPYWEAVEPLLGAAEAAQVAGGAPDPRIGRIDDAMAFLDEALPHFKAMFDISTHHAHEEINLLAIDFSTMFYDTLVPMPSWRAHYRSSDQTPHYAYLKRVLQVLQWTRPHGQLDGSSTRWLLKSPQHLEQFGPLITTFPDAAVLVTHRDPVSVTASLATMLTYVGWMSHATIDPERIGAFWLDTIDEMLAAAVRDRALLPADQSIDIHFDRFMADSWSVIEDVYALADQPLDDPVERSIRDYLAEHGRGRHGRLVYDLADFGYDEREMRDRFAGYVDFFGVREEPVRPPS